MKDLNAPQHWHAWLRACAKSPTNPIRIPKPDGGLAMLTGQDFRALGAVAHCWCLYAASDDDGREGALQAIRDLLPAMQAKCHFFVRELVAQSLDWDDRDRLWDKVLAVPERTTERETFRNRLWQAIREWSDSEGCRRGHGAPGLVAWLSDALDSEQQTLLHLWLRPDPSEALPSAAGTCRVARPGHCVWCDGEMSDG